MGIVSCNTDKTCKKKKERKKTAAIRTKINEVFGDISALFGSDLLIETMFKI